MIKEIFTYFLSIAFCSIVLFAISTSAVLAQSWDGVETVFEFDDGPRLVPAPKMMAGTFEGMSNEYSMARVELRDVYGSIVADFGGHP